MVDPHQAPGQRSDHGLGKPGPWSPSLLAFPVAMALATGTEAPATSIAQLGQLGTETESAGLGRGTLALTIGIVGSP